MWCWDRKKTKDLKFRSDMGKDSYRFAYDPVAALNNAEKLLGMELRKCGPNKLCGPYYIDGSLHNYRKDKIKVYLSKGSMWISEEGGDTESLPNWLIKYGKCADFKEALRVINGESQAVQWDRPEHKRAVPKLQYVPREALEGAARYDLNKCNFFRWLCTMFPEQSVRDVFKKYNVTSDSHGNTVFWVVDKDGHILFDKRVYFKEDGHRDRAFFPARQYRVADGFAGKAYFGECVPDDGKKAFLVESEKAVLLGSLYYGRRFLATGGKNNVRDIGENVLLAPDYDAVDLWASKGPVWKWWEKWPEEAGPIPEHADIGDLIEWKILHNKK